ncbi:hypothetical protein N7540_008978 [Penicillium herquei]|nr:hypothetical protein N7540_008978 [Penicillium herquei]
MERSSAYSALTQNRFFTQHLLRALSQPDPPPKIQSNSSLLRCLNREAESNSLPITQPAEQRVGDLTTALAQTLRPTTKEACSQLTDARAPSTPRKTHSVHSPDRVSLAHCFDP